MFFINNLLYHPMGADGRGPKLSGWKLLFIGIEFLKWIYVANPEKDI